MKRVFFVSTGRTGTKCLAALFNQYEGVNGVHEALPPFYHTGVRVANNEKKLTLIDKQAFWISRQICDNFKLRYEHPIYQIEDAKGKFPFISRALSPQNIAKNVIKRILNMPKRSSLYVETNSYLFSLIPFVRSIFPKCTIIHILRDGRDYVKSAMNRSWYEENDFKPRVSGFKAGFTSRQCWNKLTSYEKNAWAWVIKNKMIEKAEPEVVVKFEDIFDPSRAGLKELSEKTCLPYKENIVEEVLAKPVDDRAVPQKFSSFEDFPTSWKQNIDDILQPYLQQKGY